MHNNSNIESNELFELSYAFVFFGIFGIITNTLWTILMAKNNKNSRIKKYYIGFAICAGVNAFASVIEFSRAIMYKESKIMVSSIYCILYAVHPTLYIFADIGIVQIMFSMSINCFVTVATINNKRWIKSYITLQILGFVVNFLLVLLSIAFIWYTAISIKEPTVRITCYLTEVLDSKCITFYAVSSNLFSFLTIIVLIWTLVKVKRKISLPATCTLIIQLKIHSKNIKSLLVLALFTFFMLFIPLIFMLLHKTGNIAPDMENISWLLQVALYALHAFYRILSSNQIIHLLKKHFNNGIRIFNSFSNFSICQNKGNNTACEQVQNTDNTQKH
ncbi:hypothetical protein T4A_9014 [Trichinella pseudospiralis]|uniref:G-protein coupled receptors family 1 profile domain-containing protein n=1 Tax=Trichinella pseudospiralis TaxID=6337 RepID=A0A0V1ES54_TRIPS|nr:hypothetical protein T4A_9014 [Trichinella pseudospiralis]